MLVLGPPAEPGGGRLVAHLRPPGDQGIESLGQSARVERPDRGVLGGKTRNNLIPGRPLVPAEDQTIVEEGAQVEPDEVQGHSWQIIWMISKNCSASRYFRSRLPQTATLSEGADRFERYRLSFKQFSLLWGKVWQKSPRMW